MNLLRAFTTDSKEKGARSHLPLISNFWLGPELDIGSFQVFEPQSVVFGLVGRRNQIGGRLEFKFWFCFL